MKLFLPTSSLASQLPQGAVGLLRIMIDTKPNP